MARFKKKKKVFEHKMCILILYTTLVSNIFHSKKNLATYLINVKTSSRKVHFIISDFKHTLIFSRNFLKKTKTLNFIKIRPIKAESLHEDGHRERHDESNIRLSQFCESA
jgi:hypothetical protein